MDNLPKDIQKLIYWHLWKMNIHNCHNEIVNKKMTIIDAIYKYHNDDNLNCSAWKKTRIDFYSFVCSSLYAKMIDNLKYYAQIQYLHVFGEPDMLEEQWSFDTYKTINKIYKTRVLIDIPDIPKGAVIF